MYYLKKIGWYLDYEDRLFMYKGNPKLEKELKTSSSKKIFSFIKSLANPVPENELRSLNGSLSDNEFKEILLFFMKQKWVYSSKKISNLELRLKNFVDCIPGQTFPEYKSTVKKKNILILGVGTGGSYLLEVLTKLGFENFVLIDGDTVEEKNIAAQNYSKEDCGTYKAIVQQQKYFDSNISVKIITQSINSYAQLKKDVDFENIDFFINCADDFNLQEEILNNIFLDYPKLKMTYGGYSFLLHSDTLITKSNYQKLLKRALSEKNATNLDTYISENSGSIFNGFLSAYIIPKIIFNDIVRLPEQETFIADLFNDKYVFL
ncbi:ThiF family adenylyltransferase [Dellaglioa sp. L3N]